MEEAGEVAPQDRLYTQPALTAASREATAAVARQKAADGSSQETKQAPPLCLALLAASPDQLVLAAFSALVFGLAYMSLTGLYLGS
jgi:hypothetical protein